MLEDKIDEALPATIHVSADGFTAILVIALICSADSIMEETYASLSAEDRAHMNELRAKYAGAGVQVQQQLM